MMMLLLSTRSSLPLLLFSLLLSWCCCINALNPIEIRGYKFFDTVTGEEFRIRGIDYYPRPNRGELNHNSMDYLTEEHRYIWERDLIHLQRLGINAIRIYSIEAKFNHDAFFCALDRAGIYAIVELAHSCPTCAITKDTAPTCYPMQLKLQGQDVIRHMSKYSNVLAFSAGNEVNHYAPPGSPQHNAPCQKKFLRDMRQFVNSCSTMRNVPIGLVAADSDRGANAMYYNCQSNPDDPFEAAEWFGLNTYVNCDGHVQKYEDALGFHTLQEDFASYNYSIPVVLTEFGCLSETFPTMNGNEAQRDFKQAYWMHTEPSLRDQFVGGFAFEYSMEMEAAKAESPYPFAKFGHANYGIGYFGPESCDDVHIPCNYHPLPSFDNLLQQYAAVRDNPNTTNSVTLSNYVIPEYRQGRTMCPTEFPPLHAFLWEADHVPDLACRSEPTTFVCPANLDDLRPKPSRLYLLVVGAAMLFLSVAMTMHLLLVSLLRHDDRSGKEDDQTLPSWPTYVVVPKLRRSGDDETASSESRGLLSLKDMPKGEYHAIESETSSSSGEKN